MEGKNEFRLAEMVGFWRGHARFGGVGSFFKKKGPEANNFVEGGGGAPQGRSKKKFVCFFGLELGLHKFFSFCTNFPLRGNPGRGGGILFFRGLFFLGGAACRICRERGGAGRPAGGIGAGAVSGKLKNLAQIRFGPFSGLGPGGLFHWGPKKCGPTPGTWFFWGLGPGPIVGPKAKKGPRGNKEQFPKRRPGISFRACFRGPGETGWVVDFWGPRRKLFEKKKIRPGFSGFTGAGKNPTRGGTAGGEMGGGPAASFGVFRLCFRGRGPGMVPVFFYSMVCWGMVGGNGAGQGKGGNGGAQTTKGGDGGLPPAD